MNKASLVEIESFFRKIFDINDKKLSLIKLSDLQDSFRRKFLTELTEDDLAVFFGYNKKIRERFKRLENGDFERIRSLLFGDVDYFPLPTEKKSDVSPVVTPYSGSSVFGGEEQLKKIGATWFVSYAYYEYIDKSHMNWDRISTVSFRISVYNCSRCYHKGWLQQVLNMDYGRIGTNSLGVSPSETKRMAQELLDKKFKN